MSKLKVIISTVLGLFAIIFTVITALIFIYRFTLDSAIVIACILYLLDAILAYIIINSNRSNYSKACWLFTIILFGFFGHAIFFLFGIEPLKMKKRKSKHQWQQTDFASKNKNIEQHSDLVFPFEYGKKILKRPIYSNNHIEIIYDNTQIFLKSIELIRSAKYFINLQTFIFRWSGFWTKILFTELIKKANQGVKIRILYDSFGCFRKIKNKHFKIFKKYGIEIQKFNTLGTNIFKGTTNYRLHSKLLLIDNKIALYGGSNFGDEYISMSKEKGLWVDYNTIIAGPIVTSMSQSFIEYWTTFCHFDKQTSLQNILNDRKMLTTEKIFKKTNIQMQLLSFDPNYNKFAFEQILINAFFNAKKSIKIITPYFCPSQAIIDSLLMAHSKNVDIEIIVPSKNVNFVQIMNRYCYKNLIKNNIKVYEHDGFIHSKLYIIDNEYTFIGSCNLDYRSIFLTFESLLVTENKQFINNNVDFFNRQKTISHLINEDMLNKGLTHANIFACKIMNLGKLLF